SQIELSHRGLTSAEAHLYQRLATPLLIPGPALRPPAAARSANRLGQSALWRRGVSGDRPILLARLSQHEQLELARQLLAAHGFWRRKGVEVDLLLLNEHASSYQDELLQGLMTLVRTSDAHGLVGRPGGVFLFKADQLASEDRTLLLAAANVVLS